TRVTRISALTGLADEETRRALCVLLALGALKVSVAKTVSAELDCNIVYPNGSSGDLDADVMASASPSLDTQPLQPPAASRRERISSSETARCESRGAAPGSRSEKHDLNAAGPGQAVPDPFSYRPPNASAAVEPDTSEDVADA